MWIWGTVCQYRTVFHLQYQCISVRSELPSFSNCERHWPVEHCKPGPFNRSKLCEMWSVEWLHAYIFLHDTDAIHFKIHSKEYKFWLLSGSPLGWGVCPQKPTLHLDTFVPGELVHRHIWLLTKKEITMWWRSAFFTDAGNSPWSRSRFTDLLKGTSAGRMLVTRAELKGGPPYSLSGCPLYELRVNYRRSERVRGNKTIGVG